MSELTREQVKQHLDALSLCLAYPALDDLHALDEADASLRQQLATARQAVWEEIVKEMEGSGNAKLSGWIDWCREQARKEQP